MKEARDFTSAYSRLDQATLLKIQSELDVRIVMMTHAKKVETRKSFTSLGDIALAMHAELLKKDDRTPRWMYMEKSLKVSPKTSSDSGVALREVDMSGNISDEIMKDRGFVEGAIVACVDKEVVGVFIIKKVEENVHVLPYDEDEECEKSDKELKEISRGEIMAKWRTKELVKRELYKRGEQADPAVNVDMLCDSVKGVVLASMREVFIKFSSQEDAVEIARRRNHTKVRSGKDFKVGSFKLCAFSKSVITKDPTKKSKINDDKALEIGEFDLGLDCKIKAFIKPSLVFPRDGVTTAPFIVAYWAVRPTVDHTEANCIKSSHDINVSIGARKFTVQVPILVNTKIIKARSFSRCFAFLLNVVCATLSLVATARRTTRSCS